SMGMAALKREGLSVGSGQIMTLNAVMKIGSVMETITVTDTPDNRGSAPLVRDWSGARASEKPDPCATSTNGGCLRPPVKIKDVRPVYPAGVPGSVVILNGTIDATGHMAALEVLRSADPALSSAAI